MLKALSWGLLDLFPKFKNRAKRTFSRFSGISQDEQNSDSQNTFYVETIKRFLGSEELLVKFRRPYDYREILEHVSYKIGKSYLEQIAENRKADFINLVIANKKNDEFGRPITFSYQKVGKVSPTTLRYIATALDIEKEIGIKPNDSIAEIGVGYGGQAAVISRCFGVQSYSMYDLPEARKLTTIYLREIGSDLQPIFADLSSSPKDFDVLISNYAYSELPRGLQEEYLQTVLMRSKRGYMIMNSGRGNKTGRSDGKLSLEELLSCIPNSRVKEEEPLTGPDNYVFLWG